MPGNLGSGVGYLVWLGSGIVAGFTAYLIALIVEPFERVRGLSALATLVKRAGLVGSAAPVAIFAITSLSG